MRWAGALLGFGQVAEYGHWPAWRTRDNVRLVAVADPDASRRERAAELIAGVRTYSDAATLLASETLDFVDIAAPPSDHMPLAAAAARAGCHMLCEKPLTTSAAEYVASRAAAERAGVRLIPVHNWRYAPQFQQATSLLNTDTIGALRHVCLDVTRTRPAGNSGWRRETARAGGGILVDHGWHAFYLLQGFARERPLRVRAGTSNASAAAGEDTAWCTVDFASCTANIYLTWTGRERCTRWHLTGERGDIIVEDDRLDVIHDGRRSRERFAESLSAGSYHPEWFGAVIDEFLREISHPSTPTRRSARGLVEAEMCLLLTTLAYASAAAGGRPLPVPATLDVTSLPGAHPASEGSG